MDGTLVDSMGYWKRLAGEYLETHGVLNPPKDILEKIKPMTMTESAALFIREFGLQGTPEQVADDMNAMMDEHYRSDIPLKAGVKEYLTRLRDRGVRMCVASATAEPLMEACLSRLGVREDFEFLLSCETVGAGKRQPDVYLESIRRMGAEPSETAVYEDALYAAQTAKEAGFYVVGVYDGSVTLHPVLTSPRKTPLILQATPQSTPRPPLSHPPTSVRSPLSSAAARRAATESCWRRAHLPNNMGSSQASHSFRPGANARVWLWCRQITSYTCENPTS